MKTTSPFDSQTSWLRAHAVSGCAAFSLVLGACGQADSGTLHHLGDTAAASDVADVSTPKLTDLEGSWVGEAEDPLAPAVNGAPAVYHFPSGATQIHLDYNPAKRSRSEANGTLYFGADAPPPPPSNFDVGYPEGVNYFENGLTAQTLPPLEGFRYTLTAKGGSGVEWLTDADVSDGVFRFYVSQNEVFQDWCAAQPSLPLLDGRTYTCVGTQGYGASTDGCEMVQPGLPADGVNPMIPVDCGKLFLCAGLPTPLCQCNTQSCTANVVNDYGLFLHRQGEEFVGSFVQTPFIDAKGSPTSVGTVRFHRAD
jgi:hypothetical protein